MGAWQNHRSRQAGKFAKMSYELQAAQAGTAAYAAHAQAAMAHAAQAAQLDHYWFSQGWNAFYKQPYVSATDAAAYAAFQRGWYQAQHYTQQLGAGQTAAIQAPSERVDGPGSQPAIAAPPVPQIQGPDPV